MTVDAKNEKLPSVMTDEEFLAELERWATIIESVSFGRAPEVAQLMEQLGLDPNDECAAPEVVNGVQSGCPLCCVLFFVSIWSKSALLSCHLDEFVSSNYRRLVTRARRQGKLKAGYIPCPACLLTMIGPEEELAEMADRMRSSRKT